MSPDAGGGVRVLRSGVVRGKRAASGVRRYFPGGWAAGVLPVQAFAVDHPDGVCLFDAGQAATAGPFAGLHPFHRLSRFELDPVDEIHLAVDPESVRWVVLSHLHTDHVGSVGAFPHAEVLVSRHEWERAAGTLGRIRGYVQHRWPEAVTPRLLTLDGPPLGPFPATYDVAGDDRLVVVATPGHTPGHLSLLVETDLGRVLLAGDLVHTARELALVAPAIGAWCETNDVVVLAAHDPGASELLARRTRRAGNDG